MHKKNLELEKENKVLSKKVDVIMTQFSVLLGAIRDGNASTQVLDAAQKALEVANTKVHNGACDDGENVKTGDAPQKSPE